MALTIDLAPEEETLLGERAAQQGQETATYAAQVLRRLISTPPEASSEPPHGQTLAEALAGYIGVVDSRELNGGRMSDLAQNSEEEFGKIMDDKKRRGHV